MPEQTPALRNADPQGFRVRTYPTAQDAFKAAEQGHVWAGDIVLVPTEGIVALATYPSRNHIYALSRKQGPFLGAMTTSEGYLDGFAAFEVAMAIVRDVLRYA